MHNYIHFVYNSKDAATRPRDTTFGTEDLEDYPQPLLRKDAVTRLTTVSRRFLQDADPHAALSILNILVAWYDLAEIDSAKLLAEILTCGVPDSLLMARVYIQHAAAIAKRATFEVANILLAEAKNAVAFLGPSEFVNEIRLIEAKMGFIALGGLGALSAPLAAAVLEGEYVAMLQDFILAAQYSLAAKAVTEYMACINYLAQPTRVNEILELADLLGTLSGNSAYMWTARLIALGSTPLRGQIAFGRQSIWCQTYLEKYSETGAWELSRRYALYYSVYNHQIGDLDKQLLWKVASSAFHARITNDPREKLSGMHSTFMVMARRIQNLEEEDFDELELEDVQQFGINGFEACEKAGFSDLARLFLEDLSHVGIVPEQVLHASTEKVPPAVVPLGEPRNLEADELLALYIQQRNLLDRLLEYGCVDKAFKVHSQFNAYIDPIIDVLRHGTDLHLRAGDFSLVQNSMHVRLSRGLLRSDKATYKQQMSAFAIAKTAVEQCRVVGDLHMQREALLVAAQWAFRMKEVNWGKVVMDFLREADDCMNTSRKHVRAVSRIDSLYQKQQLVASYGRSDVYVFGYMIMSALMDSPPLLAVLNPEDKVTAVDVWSWMQRGKARSVVDLIQAGQHSEPPQTTLAVSSTGNAVSGASTDKASIVADIESGISLEDVKLMASDYTKSETGSTMVTVDWFISKSNIEMIVVDAAGKVHVETLDWTVETAMKYLTHKKVVLRGSADVKAWKEAYLGQSEFLSDILTVEALSELDWLVEPLAKHSKPGDLLVFCPSGILHGLPLHAVPLDGQPLIERNPIAYTNSLSLLLSSFRNARDREMTAATSAVFGVYGKAGNNQPKTSEEQKVEETLNFVSTVLDTKVEYGVSPKKFVERCKDQHIIHYHGHAILGKAKQSKFEQSLLLANSSTESDLLHWDDAIEDSLLLSATDDLGPASSSARLSARDMIAQLTLSSAHVTLIACNSASQQFSIGDEPQGMIPVLLLCGATSVLGTLWPILSSDGRAFSESFYKSFEKAGSVVNLARAAQASVLAIKAERPEPIHWAGFVLHGAWFHKC